MENNAGFSGMYRVSIPLAQDFQFVHEPLDASSFLRFVGREGELTTLVDRMTHSQGGAILITGYRGVGKTSFVNQALAKFERCCPGCRVLAVHLNLARPIMPLDLMFLVLRCIYLELRQSSFCDELDPDVMAELLLAYNRTIMTIKETRSGAAELSLNGPELTGSFAGAGLKASSFISYKRSRLNGDENAYLAYDERAAEYDLIRIARRLRGAWVGRPTWWQRILRRPAEPKGELRMIFVFDEMDKIEEPEILDNLFSTLKNVFTTSGLTFIFVAGKDIQERWDAEVRRGDSIYESVLAHDVYLPCLWNQARNCCAGVSQAPHSIEADTIWNAISFKGRGIPRRILQSFHRMVRFENDLPVLAVTPYEYRDAEFYAGLEAVLENFRKAPGLPDADKRLLGLYYLVDWILDRGRQEFTLADTVVAYEALNNKLVFSGTMVAQIEALIGALQSRGYIEKAGRVDEKQFLQHQDASVSRYRVAGSNLPENGGRKSPQSQEQIRFGPFLALSPISSGGFGRVIRALDTRSSEVVAIKYVREPSSQVRSIFARESEILSAISHIAIPRLRASGLEGEIAWIAMDFVDAASLQRILLKCGKLPEEAVVYAITAIARVCASLHASGYVYGDLKPSNVLVSRNGEVVLVDFSTARRVESLPAAFGVFGTPAYMAPELLAGASNSIRGDIYAFGVLSYELLCGRPPFLVTDNYEHLIERIKIRDFRAPSALETVSPVLEKLILSCMDPDAEKRFSDLNDVLAILSSLVGSQEVLAEEVGDQGAPSAEAGLDDDITHIPRAVTRPITGSSAPLSVPTFTAFPDRPPVVMAPRRSISVATHPITVVAAQLTPPDESPPHAVGSRTAIDSASLRTLPKIPAASAYLFPLSRSTTRIGRNFESEICIDDGAFSRTHAIITLEEGGYWLRDAGSLNGTSLNGEKLPSREGVRLFGKDVIEIGTSSSYSK